MIREIVNELLVENIDINYILKYLLNKFIKDLNNNKISRDIFFQILNIIKETSYKTSTGLRPIIHIESCLINLLDIL